MNCISIESVKASGRRLIVDFKCRGQVGKFFQTESLRADYKTTKRFYADYSVSVQDVPEEILIIPFLSAVLPIVWANHAAIYVNVVDETFVKSMKEYKKALQTLYPKLSLGGGIIAKRISKKKVGSGSRNMMLFSGGVDALTTFIRHQNEHLTLVCIHGGGIDPDNTIGWAGAIGPIIEFAHNNESQLRTVRSNFKKMIDWLIIRVYDKYLNETDGWWERVMFGLALLGLSAPLAYAERTGKLYIAASHTSNFSGGWASHPSLDNTVKWTGTDVIHDGYDLCRQEKLFLISDYFKNCDARVTIRVCWSTETGGNCGQCEKCSLTIVGLELAGLDPNKYGFNLKPDTFLNIRKKLLNGWWGFKDDEIFTWDDIKRHAYLKDNMIHSEAKLLIHWLETVDIASFRTTRPRIPGAKPWAFHNDFGGKLNPLFMCLPDPIYRIAKTCYLVMAARFAFLR